MNRKLRLLALPLLLLLFNHDLFAQHNATIIVGVGKTIKEAVPTTDLYEYPQFMQGTVVYRDGNRSFGSMNYNRFLDEMQFITAKRDTLTLINEKTIAFINIGADTFFYDQGYIKSVLSTTHVKLGEKQMLRIVDKQRIGAYGVASSVESIDTKNAYNDGVKNYNMTVMQQLLLAREVQYYLGDTYNHFVLANKKNVMKFFSKQQRALESYLKENNIEFTNKEDLEKLFQFLNQL